MDFENISPQVKALCIIPMLGLFFYEIITSSNQYQNKKRLEKNIENSFHGIIAEKQLDKYNRNAPFVKFSNSNNLYIDKIFWDKLGIGDSLNKESGDSILFVYRNKDIIKLDYKNVFTYWDSIYKANP